MKLQKNTCLKLWKVLNTPELFGDDTPGLQGKFKESFVLVFGWLVASVFGWLWFGLVWFNLTQEYF